MAIFTDSARRKAVRCKALARRGSHSTSRASNTAYGRFSPCPEGATEQRHCRVAVLDKGSSIACELRLALAQLGGSESVYIAMKEYEFNRILDASKAVVGGSVDLS
jgi:hypothetical protein